MEMVNGHPRRLNERHYTPVERAIREVVYQVEALGAHVWLTDAVVLLDQVKNKVADWIELPKPPEPRKASDPADIREKGWVVAVHNDYREKGELRTFWLFTKDGRAIKGEGPSDASALSQVRDQIAEIEKTTPMKANHCKLCHSPFTTINHQSLATCDCAQKRPAELAAAQKIWDETRHLPSASIQKDAR